MTFTEIQCELDFSTSCLGSKNLQIHMTVRQISTGEADVDLFLIPNKKTNWKGAFYRMKGN